MTAKRKSANGPVKQPRPPYRAVALLFAMGGETSGG